MLRVLSFREAIDSDIHSFKHTIGAMVKELTELEPYREALPPLELDYHVPDWLHGVPEGMNEEYIPFTLTCKLHAFVEDSKVADSFVQSVSMWLRGHNHKAATYLLRMRYSHYFKLELQGYDLKITIQTTQRKVRWDVE